jgi:uncharacterized membrane protein
MNSTENEAPPGFLRNLRKTFFTGLVLCLPLALTAYVVKFLLDLLASPAKDFLVLPVLKTFLKGERATEILDTVPVHIAITLVSALLVVLVILSFGFVTRHLLGRVVFDAFEGMLERVPMVNKVYNAAKQMVDTFGSKADTFKEVVIVEYPRAGCRSVGFVANRTPASRWGHAEDGEKLVHVFVPTAPNPTAGFILLLPESEVTPAGMTVAEGMKFIVSCGAFMPGDTVAAPAAAK